MYQIKMASRALKRNGLYTKINVFGLAISMAVVGFIALWIYGALTFDAFHTHAKDTYLITSTLIREDTGAELQFESASYGLESVLEQIPDIQNTAMLAFSNGFQTAIVNDQAYKTLGRVFVNSDWFTVFDYTLLDGSLDGFGTDPFRIVLTQSEAKRFLGNESAVGKILKMEEQLFTVQAVVKDAPLNSSFTYTMMLPIEAQGINPQWSQYKYDRNYYDASFFILLSKGADKEYITRSIDQYFIENNRTITTHLLPLKSMYFDERISQSNFARGDSKTIYLLSVLAILLLVVACLNYINLTTARAHVRAKEVDIRKILGAKPWNLFGQLIHEALWTNLLAMACAILFIMALTPFFGSVFNLSMSYLRSPVLWLVFVSVFGVTTLLSGVYPAMLSSLKPLTAIRGNNISGLKSKTVRRVLVVFQFVVSAGLVLGTLTLIQQMKYIRNNDPGYDRHGVAAFNLPPDVSRAQRASVLQSIKHELQSYTTVQNVSLSSSHSIAQSTRAINGMADWDGFDDSGSRYRDFNIRIGNMNVDVDYLQTLGLTIVEGRWFDVNNSADRLNVVLNETAVKELNIKEPYIGQRFSVMDRQGQVIGIVKDFHFNSMHHKIGPMVLTNSEDANLYVMFKSQPGKMLASVEAAKQVWSNFFPNAPFEVTYTEDVFNNLYKDDTKLAQMVSILGILSVLISCLGLFGLVTFAAERKTKEIGIRKIMGASVADIVKMLLKEFLIMVGIAMLIAFPLAYYWLDRMLQDFAYRINISWWIFVLAGIITVVLTLLTVGWRAIKAATENPVKAIKME